MTTQCINTIASAVIQQTEMGVAKRNCLSQVLLIFFVLRNNSVSVIKVRFITIIQFVSDIYVNNTCH